MKLTVVTAAAALPVLMADIKLHLRLDTDTSDEDRLLERLARTSAERCSQETGRAVLTTTYQVEAGIDEVLLLPKPPFVEMVSVTGVAEDGTTTVLTTDDYTLTGTAQKTLVTITNPGDAVTVRIRYDAGYGAAADDLPNAMISWMLMDIATLYEQRQAVTAGQANAVPYPFVGGLLDSLRVEF